MKKLYLYIFLIFSSFALAQSSTSTCENAAAMCSGNQGPFNNFTSDPRDNLGTIGCLFSTPNPAWFYLQVGSSGNIDLTLNQISNGGAEIDVDFILWGPFNSVGAMCTNLSGYSPGYVGPSNVVDCSYSPFAIEQVNIPGAVAGQYYMLLVTNFSNQAGTYTLNQTGGAGTLSCNIVCGVTLGPDRILCGAATNVTLTASFLQSPTTSGSPVYSWFLNGVFQYTTATNSTVVNQNGTWTVEVVRPGCDDLATDDIEVFFGSIPPFNAIPPIVATPGECNPIIDLTTYEAALVAPMDPTGLVFVYSDENSDLIDDPTTFSPTVTTIVVIEIFNGPCSNFDIIDVIVDCVPASCQLDLTSATETTNQTICLGETITDITYTFGGDATNVTVVDLPVGVNATIASGVLTIDGTPSATGSFTYTVSSVGCSPELTLQGTITIANAPTFTNLSAVTPICEGEDAVFTLVGSAGARVEYTINGGAVQTETLNAAGEVIITIPAVTANTTIVVSEIAIGSCIVVLNETATVVVNPNPEMTSVTTNSPICANEDAIFTLEGTPNATITYAINGGATQATTTDASGAATVTIVGATLDQTITLSLIEDANCDMVLTNTVTVVVNPNPEVTLLTTNSPICENQDSVFTIQGTPNATITYSINAGADQTTTTDASGVATVTIAGVTADQTITLSLIESTATCTTVVTNTATVVVNPNPVFTSLTANSPICENEDAVFTLEGTPNATITYTVNGGATQTTTTDASGVATVTIVGATLDQSITLSLIEDANCATVLTNTATVVVNPNPEVTSLTSNSPICANEDAIFTIEGTPNATITYSINAGADQTTTTDASGVATVTIAGVTADQTITLSLIVDANNCQLVLSNTATVVVNPNPVFTSVTANSPICANEDAIFTLEGAPNATITYNINGGADQTTTTDASGIAIVTIAGATTDQVIVVTAIESNNCKTPVNQTATVVVNPNPEVTSVTTNSPICEGETALFTIGGTPNTVVSYTLNSGTLQTVLLDASGNGTVSVAAVTANQTITLTEVANTTSLCDTVLNITATVTVSPLPTASLTSANPATCSGGSVILNFTGTPNAIVSFTDGTNNYNVTLDATGVNNYTTPPISSTTTFTLTSVATTTTLSCSQLVGDSVTVVITPRPIMTTSPNPLVLCNGATMNLVLNSNVLGTTYRWTASTTNIQSSFVLDGDESNVNQVVLLQDPMVVGYIRIVVIPTANGCDGQPVTIEVFVNPIPVVTQPVVVSSQAVCSNSQVIISVVGTPSGLSYTWQAVNINGVTIVSGVTSGTSSTGNITATLETTEPLVSGTIQFEITPIRNGCVGSSVLSPVITVNPMPGIPVGQIESFICSERNANLNISITPFIAGTELDWEVVEAVNVVDGYATQGSGVESIYINDQLFNITHQRGFVRYRVTTRLNGCLGESEDFIVYVDPLPKPTLQDGAICVDSPGGSAFQTYVLNSGLSGTMYDFDWYFNGTLTAETGNTFTATQAGEYSLIVTNTITGCFSEEVFANVIEVQPATAITYTVTDAFSDNATITVNVTGGTGTLLYQLDDEGFQESNVFTGVAPGPHTVTVIDTQGCTYLTVNPFVINYPPFFTPNGDGFNDTWNITGLKDQPESKIYIFDRYGKLLKQISPSGLGWDGRFNGAELPSTDYWFTVEYLENEQPKTFKAHFSMIR